MDDPRERWRPVPDTDRLYEVSDLGRVRRVGRDGQPDRILVPSAGPKGHLTVRISVGGRKRALVVSTLVARAFLRPTLIYRDGDPSNCRASNLEWTTQAAVNREKRWYRKLSDEAREEIRAAKGRESALDLSNRHGVTPRTIYHIWNKL